MALTKHAKLQIGRAPLGRVAVATLAIFGLSAMVLAPDTAGASTKKVIVTAMQNSKLGTILVSGTTLYTLKSNGTACTDSCLKYWPELLLPKGVTTATAGKGVSAAKLGTVKRAGGLYQVTYAGRPLYHFSEDTSPGQVKGDVSDTWGTWSAVITKKSSSGSGGASTTTTTSPGGGGVGF
jgi:predicted lipoprotein with Yx(FWY)xxD motif